VNEISDKNIEFLTGLFFCQLNAETNDRRKGRRGKARQDHLVLWE
jgi:hypothetical protein